MFEISSVTLSSYCHFPYNSPKCESVLLQFPNIFVSFHYSCIRSNLSCDYIFIFTMAFFVPTAAIAVGSAHFGQGNGTIWLDNVSCTGRETNISECRHPGFGIQNCAHNKDAGVQCQAGITVGCSFDM